MSVRRIVAAVTLQSTCKRSQQPRDEAHHALPANGRWVRANLTLTPINKEPTTCSNQSWMRA
jgi:hypothetical protein